MKSLIYTGTNQWMALKKKTKILVLFCTVQAASEAQKV